MKNSIIFVMLLVGIGKVLFPSHILVDMSGHWTILLFALCYLLASGNFDKLINRLTRIKIPGVEAQLAEMKTVRDETVASASEMKKLKKDLKDATFASARQQALLIMQIGRFVSDDHITERVKSVKTGCGPCVSSLAALGLGEPYGDTRIGWGRRFSDWGTRVLSRQRGERLVRRRCRSIYRQWIRRVFGRHW